METRQYRARHGSMSSVTTSGFSKKEILYGSLMGDGYLFGNDRYTKRFGFFQQEKNKQYVEFLATILGEHYKNINILYKKPKERWNTKGQHGFQITDKYFNHLYKTFYPKKRKRVTQKILRVLTPLSLAIWHMDDGSLIIPKRKYVNKNSETVYHNGGRWIILSTHSFTLKEHKMIQKYFKDFWDIECKIGRGKGGFFIKLYANDAIKFIEIIYPYIQPCMFYKIDMGYSKKNSRSPHKARHDKIVKIWSELYGDIESYSTE